MQHDVARPPGHWARHLLTIAGVCLVASAATPRQATAQCTSTILTLSPCNASVTVAANMANQKYVFTFTNLEAIQQQVSVAVTCTGYVTSCTSSASFVHLAANGSGTDTVTFSTGTGTTGTFKLTGGTLSSTITVTPPTHAAPVASLPYYNYDNVQPSLCAANCFDKVLTYATPAYYSLDTPRSVTLMYRSNTANPMVTVQVDGLDNSITPPTKMSLKVHRPGGTWINFTNGSTELFFTFSTSIQPMRLAGQFAPQDGDTQTGAYNYTAVITSYFADGTVLPDSIPLRILLENEQSSVFGAGWTVVGQQTVHVQTDSSLVITDGAGAISWFKKPTSCANPCTYVSPTGDYTTVTSPSAVWYQWGWDRKYPDGTIVSFFAGGPEVAVTDPVGNRALTFYYWNSLGFRDSVITDRMGHSLHFVYDNGSDGWESGSIRQIYDDFGRYTWFGVDNNNNQDQIEDPMGGQYGGILLAVDAVYNAQHQMISNVDRHQTPWHFGYDFAGKLSADSAPAVLADGVTQPIVTKYQSAESTFLINPSSGAGTSTNPGGFEGGGPWWANVWDPEGHQTSFTVDRWGQPLTVNDPAGGTTLYNRGGGAYTIGGIPAIQIYYPWGGVDQFRYNSNGLLSWTQPAGADSTTYLYRNNYAIADSVFGPNQPAISRSVVAGEVQWEQSSGDTTKFFYTDTIGRVAEIDDPAGHQSLFYYDPTFGNLYVTRATGNRTTQRTFDTYGRPYTLTASGMTATTYTWYDALNRVTKTYNGASADTTRYFYDSLYLTHVEDAKGQWYRTVVNALGWPTQVFDPADTVHLYQTYAYDRDGHVTQYTNRRGQAVNTTYDGLGRPLSKSGTGVMSATYSYSSNRQVTVGSNAVSIDTIYTNTNGWVSTVSTTYGSEQFRTNYFRNSELQLDSETVTTNTGITFPTTYYTWNDTVGQLGTIQTNGQQIQFKYYSSTGLLNTTYYGTPSNPTAAQRVDGALANGRSYATTFYNGSGYDTPANSAFARNYYYDSLTRVAQVYSPTPFTQAFTYDSLGRFNHETDYTGATCGAVDTTFGVNCANGSSSTKYSLQYDVVGNLTTNDSTLTYATGNRLQSDGSTQYTEDSDGDVIRRHDSTHDMRYGWSPDGLLVSDTVESTLATVQFAYDAFGNLVHRSTNGTSEEYYLWDQVQGQLLAELDGTATHRVEQYVYAGTDWPVVMITGSTSVASVRYPVWDQLGDILGVYTPGNVNQTISYSPFGQQQITGSVGDTNRLRWRGLMWEGDSTQLYYMRNRWYDPNTGRFMSQDPTGLGGGINAYAFGGGDYINGTDPTGLGDDPCGDDDDPGPVPDIPPIDIGDPTTVFDCAGAPWGGGGLTGGGGGGNESGGGSPKPPKGKKSLLCRFLNGGSSNGMRSPDFYAGNFNVAIKNPWTGSLVGWSGSLSIDRYGDFYWSVLGVGVGKSASTVSIGITANWMNGGMPSQALLDNMLSSFGTNFSAGYWGGASESWTPGAGTATGVGFVSPQIGVSANYSIHGGNVCN